MNPQDPYGYGPLSYDPLGRMPPAGPPVEPPVVAPPPTPPYRPPVNPLATLVTGVRLPVPARRARFWDTSGSRRSAARASSAETARWRG